MNIMKNNILAFTISVTLSFGFSPVRAGEDTKREIEPTQTNIAFCAGAKEVELRAGALFSISGNDARRPILNYASEALRVGWMLSNVRGSGFFRGNSELLAEVFGGEVTKGPGNGLGGGQLLLRYNFVQPDLRLVPYGQIGGGGLYNDIYHQPVQRRIGEGFEFILHAAVGVRWILNDRWALSLEGDYRHISNAGLANRNTGLNSMGITLGANSFF
jgi:lipid A 3-O-deacylase